MRDFKSLIIIYRMSNPFLTHIGGHGSSNITVNDIGPDVLGNIDITMQDIPNLVSTINSLTSGSLTETSSSTLTHKTIDSRTNTVTADKLHSSTTSIVIANADAPTQGQLLTAISGTAASWQNIPQIDHTSLSNKGKNTHSHAIQSGTCT